MISLMTETSQNNWDYILDKDEDFIKILPYLRPKFRGEWKIELVNPKPDLCRELLDTSLCPEYVKLTLVLPKELLATLQAERPALEAKVKTTWEYYQELILLLPVPIENKAVFMIYNRCIKHKEVLKETLELLVSKSNGEVITTKLVKAYIIDNSTVFANEVVLAFLENDRYRWKKLKEFEEYLGTKMAFYTLRKYLRKLMLDKCNYIQNKETKDRNVSKIDAFSLVHIYNEFEVATNHNQLHTIFINVERRRKCYTTARKD